MDHNSDSTAIDLLQAGMTAKKEAILQQIKRLKYATKTVKPFLGHGSSAIDVALATGALAQGDYKGAGRYAFTAAGSAIYGSIGTTAGLVFFGPVAPIASPLLAGGLSYLGGWGAGLAYDNLIPAARWTGNTIESGLRVGTQHYLSPYLEDLTTRLSYSVIDPAMKKISTSLETSTKTISSNLEQATKAASPYLESMAQGFGGFASTYLQALGDWISGKQNDYGAASKTSAYQISPGMQALIDGDFLLTNSHLYLPPTSYEPTSPYLDFYEYAPSSPAALSGATNAPARWQSAADPSQAFPMVSAPPSGGYDYPEWGDFTNLDSQTYSTFIPYFNDNIDAWDLANFSHPAIYEAAAILAKEAEAKVAQSAQARVHNPLGSAINTAYDLFSFSDVLTDVINGRRSDPGAYISLANYAAQGLNWAAGNDGVQDIVGAIGELKDPLDSVSQAAGAAGSAWGLYKNMEGLASAPAEHWQPGVLGASEPGGQPVPEHHPPGGRHAMIKTARGWRPQTPRIQRPGHPGAV